MRGRDQARLLVGDDGRLAARGRQDDRRLRLQLADHQEGRRDGARARRQRRRRARLPRLARDDARRQGGRPRHRVDDDARPAADRSRPGRGLRQEDTTRRAGDRHRHQPRRLQVHAQAHRRHPRHRTHQADPSPDPEHPPRDARLVERAAGPARGDPQVRRRHEGDLRGAGRGAAGGDQARRAQDQHRHRHPARDDRRGPQVSARESRPLRSARLPEARARRGEGDLQGALRPVRLRRAGQQDPAGAAHTVAHKYQTGELSQHVH